ncbi:probable acylpyruvase FAHD1, mitochondrial [Actinia tenebrosa]|uniref:Oxaloacetate tautomerase FAHD1, mitochondrial n=1 Tax=Actinia tenebrosa TaxID=6105 RepID=A0A6P8IP75_ACTTE|nr:probable acylpyruvase FAHD1, mitochondrial [Actinia tenebrosa]
MAKELRRFMEFGRKIVAIGRNYRDHAAELGNPIPEKPLIFLKPTSSYVCEGGNIEIPYGYKELHHEVELGVVIGKNGSCIPESDALSYIGGYALAIDMTNRKLQNEDKKKGHPWSIAKGFDTACPISNFFSKSEIADPDNLRLWLKVDEELKQDGSTCDMMFKIPFLISYVSKVMSLEEGDLLITGTPSGVSAVKAGQMITAGIGDILSMKFPVVQKS